MAFNVTLVIIVTDRASAAPEIDQISNVGTHRAWCCLHVAPAVAAADKT